MYVYMSTNKEKTEKRGEEIVYGNAFARLVVKDQSSSHVLSVCSNASYDIISIQTCTATCIYRTYTITQITKNKTKLRISVVRTLSFDTWHGSNHHSFVRKMKKEDQAKVEP